MCEHLKIVENLNTLFPKTIMLSENVLESLSNDSDIGARYLKPETIKKCKEINNLATANEKRPAVHVIMETMCACQYSPQKFITMPNLSVLQ